MVAANNRDKSDIQSDYVHVNFDARVGFASDLVRGQRSRRSPCPLLGLSKRAQSALGRAPFLRIAHSV
jgi:hypothetical protein